MKKVLFTLAIVAVLILGSCGNRKPAAVETPMVDSTEVVVDTLNVE